jgi:hypothetical protein
MIEFERERERRERPLAEKDGSIVSRAIGRGEAEMLR